MSRDVFPPTLRTWIEERLLEGPDGRREVNAHVMRVYAHPLEVYFRGTRQLDLGEPDDVVGGYFADRLGRAEFFDSWRGSGLRLRRWLMTGFGFYLKELRRERKRAARGAALGEESDVPDPDEGGRVEAEMDRAFAVSIVREALGRAREACERKGLGPHFEAFHRHYYQGLPYGDFAVELGVTPAQASEMARSAAARFRGALRDLLASDGALESEIDRELETLLEITT